MEWLYIKNSIGKKGCVIMDEEQLRKIISEELTKQLDPIVSGIKEIKSEIEILKKIDNNKAILKKDDKELKGIKSQNNPINDIKEMIRNELSEVTYNTWIADGEIIIDGNILTWFCANTFTQDIVKKRYKKLIFNVCKAVQLNIEDIKILVE